MASEGKSGRPQKAGDAKPGLKKPARRGNQSGGLRGMFNLDAEQSARLLIVGAVALVMVIAVGFLVFGYWYSVVRPRNRTVLQVGDTSISYSAMKRRMSYEFLLNTTYQSEQGYRVLPEAALQLLLNELTEITQAGPKLGISVDDAEFNKKLYGKLALPESADQRSFADALRTALDKSGLSESEYRLLARAELFNEKITEKFTADAPAVTLQAKVGVIATQSEDEAKQAIQRINAGEDFSAVAKAVSKEPDVQTTGGIKDYGPKGSLNAIYDDYAFTADIGSLSSPLTSGEDSGTGAYYVVRVIDRSDQPVSESQKSAIVARQLRDWLTDTQEEMQSNGTFKRDWDQQSQNDALSAVLVDATAKLAEQAKKKQADQRKAEEIRQTTVAQLTASPVAASTPAPDATAAPSTPDQGQSASPAAPAQPVAPGSNGQ